MKEKVQRYFGGKYILLLRWFLLLLIIILVFIPLLSGFVEEWYVENFCEVDRAVESCLLEYKQEYFFPVYFNATWLYILFGILLVLPARLLAQWLLYIGSWAVPGIILGILFADVPKYGQFPQSSPEGVATGLILFVLTITVAFVIGHLAYILALWRWNDR